MDGERDRGAHSEDAADEHRPLKADCIERVTHEEQPADEEGDGDDEGNDVHMAILGTIPPVPIMIAIAPDSFKGSLGSTAVATAMAAGWRSVRPDDYLVLVPQADGGEGTLEALETAVANSVRHAAGSVTGPDGRPVDAFWLELPGATAVVELSISSGLPLMAALDPLGATTRGLGEVIAAALDAGAQRLIIALGGSASTDGGRGALEALGWPHSLRPAPSGGVTLLSDVTAPLLGPTGAAAVFAPQKGASAAQVAELEARLAAFAAELGGDTTLPGSGAAGGTAYGFSAAWGAQILSGADYICALTGLDDVLEEADALITGEGRFDAQSLGGKVVGQLLAKAPARTVVIAGQLDAEPPDLGYSLTTLAGSSEAAMTQTAHWLHGAAAAAARDLGPTFSRARSSQ
jgi:glycerate 2-kinase